MPRPKQHHYVTRAYLDGFLLPDVNQLVCYGKNRPMFYRSPDEMAKQRNFYALKRDDGTWDDSIEELLERTVERPGLAAITKLADGKTRLTWEDRKSLSLFVAFQEMRTPAARADARLMSQIFNERVLGDIRAANPEQKSVGLIGEDGKSNEVTLDEISASHDEILDDHKMAIHRTLGTSALRLQEVYEQMKFTVWYAPNGEDFITTDSPVIRVFHGGEGFGSGIDRRDVEIRFPLSRKALLTLTHDLPRMNALEKAKGAAANKILRTLPEVRIKNACKSDVRGFNRGHVRHARLWVFTSKELDWVSELLSQPSLIPQLTDRSQGDLIHFQSKVKYDPKIDAAPS